MEGINLSPYLLIQPNEFSYVTVTSRNGGKISIALNDSNKTYICSSSYVVFKSKDMEELLPQYLMLFFQELDLTDMLDSTHGGQHEKHSIGIICVMLKFRFLI